jgi:polar amino acid transport system substrate-binding protein
MKLPLKLALPPLAGLLLTLAVLHFYWAPQQVEQARQAFQAQTSAQLRAAEPALINQLLARDLAAVVSSLDVLQAELAGRWFNLELYDDQGKRLYPLFGQRRAPQLGEEFIEQRHPLELSGTQLGYLRLDLNWAEPLQQVAKKVEGIRNFIFLLILVVTLIILLASYRLIIHPLRVLERATQRIAEGSWDLRLPPGGADEIGQLSEHFAKMALELQCREKALNDHAVVCLTDAQGRILRVNDRFARISGYSAEELIGQTHRLIKSDLHDKAYYQALWRTIQQGDTWYGEFCNHKRTGERFWVSASITPLPDKQGRPERYLGICTDITPQKQAELAMRAAREAADAANRMKSEFLANMSHEIRTPMNTIIGMSQLALDSGLEGRAQGYVSRVSQAAESLLGIIDDILDFSKIEADKLHLEQRPFELNQVFHKLDVLLGFKADEKGLELLFDIDPELPPRLLGDALRLNQILVNLVNNAIKFTEQGNIIVRLRSDPLPAEAAQIQDQDQDPCGDALLLHFQVQDSGVGISPEQQARLFQPFSQADGSITRNYGGTGLGLAICKRLTQLMGGSIWVESVPGQGSCFHFTLQCRPAEVEADLPQPDVALGRARLLLVDDNPAAREILAHLVRGLGLDPVSADSGREALEQLAQAAVQGQPFDFVLLDWQMPGMDGYECAQKIQQNISPAPKIIMVTAHGQEVLRQKSEQDQLPLAALLHKPVTPSTLLDCLLQALGRTGLRARSGLDRADQEVNYRSDYGADYREVIAQLAGAQLLLVEDNAFNQDLAMELLSRNGIGVELAVNGQAALDRLRLGSFDGVLMDCQMPVMDGYTATRLIRRQEEYRDLPIIAMTANAMAEDVAKALDAGMNDHIAKPINLRTLFFTLAKWIKPKRPAPPLALPEEGKPGRAPSRLPPFEHIDSQVGLALLEGDEGLYLSLLRMFHQNQAESAALIRQALRQGDQETAARTAHSLKGAAGTLGATGLQAQSQALEQDIKQGREISAERLDRLQTLLAQIRAEIAPLMADEAEPIQAPPAAPYSPDELVQQLRVLAEMLEEYQVESKDRLEAILAHLPDGPLRQGLEQLAPDLARFDFDQAREKLNRLI